MHIYACALFLIKLKRKRNGEGEWEKGGGGNSSSFLARASSNSNWKNSSRRVLLRLFSLFFWRSGLRMQPEMRRRNIITRRMRRNAERDHTPNAPTPQTNPKPPSAKSKNDDPACAVCDRIVCDLGYTCTDPSCMFRIHVGCAPSTGVIKSLDDREKQSMKHDSHPEHELRMLRRSDRSCSFRCDACGTIERGNSYVCSVCQYWIHESCALLVPKLEKENLHHHPLFLSFHLPKKYIHFEYNCDICQKNLFLKHWVYHCESCGYVAYLKCAINASSDHATSK